MPVRHFLAATEQIDAYRRGRLSTPEFTHAVPGHIASSFGLSQRCR